jgi:hypothetical protein
MGAPPRRLSTSLYVCSEDAVCLRTPSYYFLHPRFLAAGFFAAAFFFATTAFFAATFFFAAGIFFLLLGLSQRQPYTA